MNTTWTTQAACSADGSFQVTDPFYPETQTPRAYAEGKNVCASCPVTNECLTAALIEEQESSKDRRYGLRGGLTPGERAHIQAGTMPAPIMDPSADDQERFDLYFQGHSDESIAETQRTTPDAIRHWRTRRGLRVNREIRRHEQYWHLFNLGFTDAEMSRDLRVQSTTVARWRKGNKLAANTQRVAS